MPPTTPPPAPPSPPVALLGIGGGVAAYKAVAVASKLRQAGWATHVAMTPAAQRFVTPLTFAAVTATRTLTDIFTGPGDGSLPAIYPHLYPATEADTFCVLPATANLIAKLANGLGDDIVSVSALSLPAHCRRLFCPSMNVEMWRQPVVQENVRRLEARGWERLGPEDGHLACGMTGAGRMLEPEAILAVLLADAVRPLAGKRVLLLSGPTIEPLDPVRFISNHSSGLMGRALGLALARAGASVDLISGPVPAANLPVHPAITQIPVGTAAEMLAAAQKHFPQADAAVYVAAVADCTLAEPLPQKTKRQGPLTLTLVPTPDIAATLAHAKRPGQICLGFALETQDGLANAQGKLARKGLDAIVLNGPDSFGASEGHFTLLTSAQPSGEVWGRLDKTTCASRLVAWLARQVNG